MAENKSTFSAYRGHAIDTITIERELYWLAIAVAGSRGLYDLTPNEEDHAFDSLRVRFEVSEISRLLISVAVMLRNSMDASHPEHLESLVRKQDRLVGYIFCGKKRQNLDFREACHKIIHALQVNFDLAGNRKRKLCYLRPKIYLYGTFKGKEWRAVLDVVRFIAIAHQLS